MSEYVVAPTPCTKFETIYIFCRLSREFPVTYNTSRHKISEFPNVIHKVGKLVFHLKNEELKGFMDDTYNSIYKTLEEYNMIEKMRRINDNGVVSLLDIDYDIICRILYHNDELNDMYAAIISTNLYKSRLITEKIDNNVELTKEDISTIRYCLKSYQKYAPKFNYNNVAISNSYHRIRTKRMQNN